MPARKQPILPDELIDELMSGYDPSTLFGKGGFLDELKRSIAERALNAADEHAARSSARHFADRWETDYPKAVKCLREDLDELLTCMRYKTLKERKSVRTTNAIERRFREVRRRTRPMGVFQDTTSTDRILFAVFTYENKTQGTGAPSS